VRLAHCSDLHLLSHDGASWLELANKRWIGAANLIANRGRHHHVAAFDAMIDDLNALGIEHVLCTGDVTNLALDREFQFARAKFDKLAAGPRGVTVVPGNHDAYVAEGIAYFAATFGPYSEPDDGWRWTDADAAPRETAEELRWPIVRVRGELALVGVSTSRATPWFAAYGTIGAGQLARLRRALADERLRDKARVVAIHHPPAGRRAKNPIRGLHDHAEFARVIAEVGAELVVHGHEHRCMLEELRGPSGAVRVQGVASGTYLTGKPREPTARYRIYEIVGGKIVSEAVRLWRTDYGIRTA
jgi:3',5'-cyclic AMP phosphodiesterase CpdA